MDSENTREKWDTRYRAVDDKAHSRGADLLEMSVHLLPEQGTALDLACGLGVNAQFLAQKGLDVHAWDISPVAIEKLNRTATKANLSITTQVRDVLANPPDVEKFDVICVSRFLDRGLCPAINAALKPGGLLLYQTFIRDRQTSTGPRNSAYLLESGELPQLFLGLEILKYEEGDEAMLIARKG